MAEAWANPRYATVFGWFLLAYYVGVCWSRSTFRGPTAWYDAAWACNVAVLLTGLGAVLRNRFLVSTGITISVAVHFLWVVDVVGWALFGKFYTGSAAFIVLPTTNWITIVTTLHHVWFQPLALYLLRGNGGLPNYSYWSGWATYYILMAIGRMIPLEVTLPNGTPYYLNINMGHGCFRAVKYRALHQFNDSHPLIYFTFATFLGCGVVTFPLFLALRAISKKWLEVDTAKSPSAKTTAATKSPGRPKRD